jgi:AP endonuclease 1
MSATVRKTIATTAATAVRSSKTRRTSSPLSNDDLPARPTKRARIVKEAMPEESQESQVTLINGVAGVTIESQATLVEAPSATVKAPKGGRKKKVAAEPSPADYPPRTSRDWKVGAHISAAGGIENAVGNAAKIG